MSGKLVPFGGSNKESKAATKNPNISDSGVFGNLKFEVYDKWRTIHLIEGKKVFKKDADIFEDEFEKIDFNAMKEDEEIKIEGSGDNADLIIKIKEGDPELRLENKQMPGIRKLKEILQKSKEKVLGKKRPPRRRSDRKN